jgi:hypothetical protein
MKKEELKNAIHELWLKNIIDVVDCTRIQIDIDKHFFNASDCKDKTPKVGNNEQREKLSCIQCANLNSPYHCPPCSICYNYDKFKHN